MAQSDSRHAATSQTIDSSRARLRMREQEQEIVLLIYANIRFTLRSAMIFRGAKNFSL
jgi:hypothetical protein